MNKGELTAVVAEKMGSTKSVASKNIDAILDAIKEELGKDGEVALLGFGSFKVSSRAERPGVNPRTKEAITIPASKNVKFKAGKALKDSVN